MTSQQRKKLSLKGGTGPAGFEVVKEWIVRVVPHKSRIETGTQSLSELGFPNADRTLDRYVTELQTTRLYQPVEATSLGHLWFRQRPCFKGP